MTKQQFLWKVYLKNREESAGLALADYLEENKIDLPLAIGLKFCIKYRKFPEELKEEYRLSIFYDYYHYIWYTSDTNPYNILKGNKKI